MAKCGEIGKAVVNGNIRDLFFRISYFSHRVVKPDGIYIIHKIHMEPGLDVFGQVRGR